jgi:hypothetical protein
MANAGDPHIFLMIRGVCDNLNWNARNNTFFRKSAKYLPVSTGLECRKYHRFKSAQYVPIPPGLERRKWYLSLKICTVFANPLVVWNAIFSWIFTVFDNPNWPENAADLTLS